jgi:hypothetical protein
MPKPIAEDYEAIALARSDIVADEAVDALQLQMEAAFLEVLGKQAEPLRYDECGLNKLTVAAADVLDCFELTIPQPSPEELQELSNILIGVICRECTEEDPVNTISEFCEYVNKYFGFELLNYAPSSHP